MQEAKLDESVTQLDRTGSSTGNYINGPPTNDSTIQFIPTLACETSTELQTTKQSIGKELQSTEHTSPIYKFKTTIEGRRKVILVATFCFIMLLIIIYTVGE